jgi:hypothetical protein
MEFTVRWAMQGSFDCGTAPLRGTVPTLRMTQVIETFLATGLSRSCLRNLYGNY